MDETFKSHLKRVSLLCEIFGQYVQHPDHLGEDQDSVASFAESGQQFVQQDQLSTAPHQSLEEKKRGKKTHEEHCFYRVLKEFMSKFNTFL